MSSQSGANWFFHKNRIWQKAWPLWVRLLPKIILESTHRPGEVPYKVRLRNGLGGSKPFTYNEKQAPWRDRGLSPPVFLGISSGKVQRLHLPGKGMMTTYIWKTRNGSGSQGPQSILLTIRKDNVEDGHPFSQISPDSVVLSGSATYPAFPASLPHWYGHLISFWRFSSLLAPGGKF